ADYTDLRPKTVTFHTGRIFIDNTIKFQADVRKVLKRVDEGIDIAVRDVISCAPDHLVLGMSSETFVGGLAGSEELAERVRKLSGVGVSMGSAATRMALESIGARRIAVLTPYQPSIDEQVVQYFDDLGYELVSMSSLRCRTARSIADVTGEQVLDAFRELSESAGSDVDAFVQVGTNLTSYRVADEVERRFGKPLVGINQATIWHALHELGLDPRLRGAGRVFRRRPRI